MDVWNRLRAVGALILSGAWLAGAASLLERCVGRIGAAGQSNIGEGINAGLRVLAKGRTDFPADNTREVLLLFSDFADNAGCGNIQASAKKAKDQGVLLSTLCHNPHCSEECMRRVASSPSAAFEAQTADEIAGAFEDAGRWILRPLLPSLTITGTIGAQVELVAGSARPASAITAADGSALVWRIDKPPATGVTATWHVRTRQVGRLGLGAPWYGIGRIGEPPLHQKAVAEPHVLVLEPLPVDTSTPGPPTPTMTPSTTPTASPTVPSPPPGSRLHFPLALRDLVWR